MYGAMLYGYTRNDNLYMPNVVNVKAMGAVGNGVTDDTVALQKALDFLKTSGGVIFFPVGTYFISVQLVFYSNQKLVFEKGARILQGADMDNLIMNHSTAETGLYDAVENVEIVGGIFDGGAFETNNTLLGICHAKNIKIVDCTFVNAYGSWHNVEINSSRNVVIDGCRFEGLRKTSANGCLIQIDGFNNTATWPWGNGLVDNTISYMVEIKNCHFYDCTIPPAIGNHSDAIVDHIRIHGNIFEGLTSSRGAINFLSAKNVDVYDNTFTDCTVGITIGTADGTNTVHDNRFVGVNVVADDSCNTYANMINGSFDE